MNKRIILILISIIISCFFIIKDKIVFASSNVTIKDGKIILTESDSEIILGDYLLDLDIINLPKNNLVVFEQDRVYYNKLYAYNYQNEILYDISPYQIDEEPDYDYQGKLIEYSEFKLSPSKKYLAIKTISNAIITDEFIINLQTISSYLNAKNNQQHEVDFSKNDVFKEDVYSFPGKNIKNEMVNIYDFEWQQNDAYTFKAIDNEIINQPYLELDLDTEIVLQDIYQVDDPIENKIKHIGIYPPSPFSDLSETNEDYEYVLRAKAEGWLDGYPDGTVKMDQPIKRAEFVKILIRSFQNIEEEVIPEDIKAVCPDVPIDQWYSRAFYTARELKVVQGYPEEGKGKSEWLCKPAQTINRVEALKVVLELAKFNTKNAVLKNQYKDTGIYEWYSPYTAYAKTEDLIKITDSKLHPANPLTRGEMIVLTIKVKDLLGVDDEDWGKW